MRPVRKAIFQSGFDAKKLLLSVIRCGRDAVLNIDSTQAPGDRAGFSVTDGGAVDLDHRVYRAGGRRGKGFLLPWLERR